MNPSHNLSFPSRMADHQFRAPNTIRGYGDEHRIFVQGIMCKGVLKSSEVRDLYRLAMKRCRGQCQISVRE